MNIIVTGIVIFYLLCMLALGYYASTRVKTNADDFPSSDWIPSILEFSSA